MFLKRKGQSAVEYSLLLAVVVAALIMMHIYFKRSVQGRMRESSDDIGEQYDPGKQDYEVHTKSTSTMRETVDTTGKTVQSTEDKSGNTVEQKTLRWGQTKTNDLGDTTWGTPTK
jgi:uncharacterized protein (UPF0333 family)